MGRRTIGLASSGLGRVWPVGISLSHRAPATPVAGRAQCTLTKVARCTVFPPTHPTRLTSGLDARCVQKQCGLVGLCIGGRLTFTLRLSRARTRGVALRQDSSSDDQLDTTKLGRKKGEKFNNKKT